MSHQSCAVAKRLAPANASPPKPAIPTGAQRSGRICFLRPRKTDPSASLGMTSLVCSLGKQFYRLLNMIVDAMTDVGLDEASPPYFALLFSRQHLPYLGCFFKVIQTVRLYPPRRRFHQQFGVIIFVREKSIKRKAHGIALLFNLVVAHIDDALF
jgi:hypothetical protein